MNYLGTYKSKLLKYNTWYNSFAFSKFFFFYGKVSIRKHRLSFGEKKSLLTKYIWKTCTAISTHLEKNKKFQFFRNASCLF